MIWPNGFILFLKYFHYVTCINDSFLFIIRCWFQKSKSLSGIIRCRYGNHVLKIIRRYQKLDYRMRKLDLDIKFLNTCQSIDLCPTFIQYKISSTRFNSNVKRIKSDLRMVISLIDRTHIRRTFEFLQSKELKNSRLQTFRAYG